MLPAGSLTQQCCLQCCVLITPPPCLNQQLSTHDNNVVLATANSLENTTVRFSKSVANFHDYHASKICSVAYTQSTVEGPQYSTPSLASNLNDTTFSRYKYKSFTHSILTRHLTTFEAALTLCCLWLPQSGLNWLYVYVYT